MGPGGCSQGSSVGGKVLSPRSSKAWRVGSGFHHLWHPRQSDYICGGGWQTRSNWQLRGSEIHTAADSREGSFRSHGALMFELGFVRRVTPRVDDLHTKRRFIGHGKQQGVFSFTLLLFYKPARAFRCFYTVREITLKPPAADVCVSFGICDASSLLYSDTSEISFGGMPVGFLAAALLAVASSSLRGSGPCERGCIGPIVTRCPSPAGLTCRRITFRLYNAYICRPH